MQTQPGYDPLVVNLTPAELERLIYTGPQATTPIGQHVLSALHEAEHADAVRDVIENYNLSFDDPEDLGKNIERLVDRDQLADTRKYYLDELIGAVEDALDAIRPAALRGSAYAREADDILQRALNAVSS